MAAEPTVAAIAAAPAAREPASERGAGARILIIDDQPEVVRLVDRILAGRYLCDSALSVDEARAKLAENSFELVLCDIQLPDESGLVLIEEIACEHPHTAIVVVSATDDPEVAEGAAELGAHGYLIKPFAPGQLLITTINALRRRELEIGQEEQAHRALESLEQRAIELHFSRLETVEHLTRAIELHDSGTGEHVERMAEVAAFLGRRYGLEESRVQLLRAAAPMHDVGKIGTPREILGKPAALTADERELMERHAEMGYKLLYDSGSDLLQMAATIALTHHERFDGWGYPRGLAGEEIPIEGRLVAVADVFDALLSDRSYRPAMTVDQAVKVIRAGRGTHFDPRIVDLLLDEVETALEVRRTASELPEVLPPVRLAAGECRFPQPEPIANGGEHPRPRIGDRAYW